MKTIDLSEFATHFQMIGQTILSTNKTYGFNVVLKTVTDEIVIESAWTIFKNDAVYLDIKTGNYSDLQQMIDILVSKTIDKITISKEEGITLSLYFSDQLTLEVYLEDEYDIFWFKKINETTGYLLRSNGKFTFE